MNQTVLINFCGIGIIALILHSYFKRGLALTLNFFLFAFMLTFTKGGEHTFQFMNLVKAEPQNISHAVISTLIWVLSFYLSWCIAEKVIERVAYFKNRIFPVLLFAGLFVAYFAYAMEVTAINMAGGNALISSNNDFLLIPVYIIKKQFYFSLYFLAAYFLIACSEYKNRNWKIIFFILPFINTWIPQFFGLGMAQSIKEMLTLIILIVFAFMSPLRFDYSGIKQFSRKTFSNTEWVNLFPVVIMVVLLSILFFIDVFKIYDTSLLVSLLPLGFFVLLAIKRVPLLWVTFIALLCLMVFKQLAIPAIVPVGLLAIFQLITKFYFIKNNSVS
ncbi:MAG: hypothetical protein COV71_04855 [Candidatus Omnitrophica bacterium CG11_big_fil_rev_8_21_14_0_20_41_12]|nr:MAG: hypothetical protein COV71_04855 [Candidatus Omnitrophica bacterium CG11_big_fil_rev_8_21_14_0_20_41_12]